MPDATHAESRGASRGASQDPAEAYRSSWDQERGEQMRLRMRNVVVWVQLIWLLQHFFDDQVFVAPAVSLGYRLAELASNALVFWFLRKPRGPGAVEWAVVGWALWQSANGAICAMFAIPPQQWMIMASYGIGLLVFIPAIGLLGTRALVVAVALEIFFVPPLLSYGVAAENVLLAGLAGAAATTFVIGSATVRGRVELAEHTARRKLAAANEQLARNEEARTRLFINLSHDLRTPLAVIGTEAENLRGSPVAGVASIDRIVHNVIVVGDLVDQLLELARVDLSSLPNVARNVEVLAVARSVIAQLQPARPGQRLEIVATEPSPAARVDPRHLRRILQNLAANALRALGDGEGHVEIRASSDERRVRIDVIDDGPGVPAERRARIFERFAHFDTSGSLASGIGLPLAHELATLAGGSLVVLDGAPTTFRLELPRAAGPVDATGFTEERATAPTLPERSIARDARDPGPTADLLLAEDNPDMAGALTDLLGKRYRVEVVARADLAIARIQTQRPDLLLVDVMLAQGSGYDVLEAVRSDPGTASIPVVLLSALGSPEERARGLAAGADDYLGKPFDPAELVGRLERALARGRERRAELATQREDLALELHDGVAASLARAAVILASQDAGAHLDEVRAVVADGASEARTLLQQVSRGPRSWRELAAQISRETRDAARTAGLEAEIHLHGLDDEQSVPSAVDLALTRIAREATTNVVRHASARRLEVSLRRGPSSVSLTVSDDGRGACDRAPGTGIEGMKRRARRVGGTVVLLERPGGGTVVSTELPLALPPSGAP